MVTSYSSQLSENTNDVTRLSLKSPNYNFYNAQRVHTQFGDNKSLNLQKSSNFIICHQNICGLSNKTEEILISLSSVRPHILCITEHHLQPDEICTIHLENYTLGVHFCRSLLSMEVSQFLLQMIYNFKL